MDAHLHLGNNSSRSSYFRHRFISFPTNALPIFPLHMASLISLASQLPLPFSLFRFPPSSFMFLHFSSHSCFLLMHCSVINYFKFFPFILRFPYTPNPLPCIISLASLFFTALHLFLYTPRLMLLYIMCSDHSIPFSSTIYPISNFMSFATNTLSLHFTTHIIPPHSSPSHFSRPPTSSPLCCTQDLAHVLTLFLSQLPHKQTYPSELVPSPCQGLHVLQISSVCLSSSTPLSLTFSRNKGWGGWGCDHIGTLAYEKHLTDL